MWQKRPVSRDLAGKKKEKVIYYEGAETLKKIAQRICEYSIPENIHNQMELELRT